MDNQDSLERAKILKYYSRRDVRREIIANAESREIAVKFGESGFGKRPDVLTYEQDVYEFAKQGATSFHSSEETWQNPLNLTTSMRRQEQDTLRTGWDLVLDIDCKEKEYSAIAADLIIKALKYHGIENISCKFSVTGDTPVLIKCQGITELKTIKEAISLLKQKKLIKVLSLDFNENITFSKVYDYLEHKDQVYEVFHQKSKLPLKVTKHHSVFVWENGFIKIKKVSELKLGDFLISFTSSNKLKKTKKNISYSFLYNRKKYTKTLKITKGLLRLLGYYLAEGHATKSIHQVGFTFNLSEKEYIADCENLIKRNFGKQVSKRSPNPNSLQLLFHSKEFYEFFYGVCGVKENKHLPNFIWTLPKSYFLELLLGYIRGDGHKTGKYHISIKSVSKQLTTELIWVCKFNNISCNLFFEKSKPHTMPSGQFFKGSKVHIITIPKSDLEFPEFNVPRNKFSGFPKDKTYPTDGLKKIYSQIKPKQFIRHRKEQVTLRKKLANINRINAVIAWFKKYKSVDFNLESKQMLNNYARISKNDVSVCRIKKLSKAKKEMMYDLSVEKTERFFGNHYPILLHNSGNKGFHIGVPFESFPKIINQKETKLLFPEAPRAIAMYIKQMILPHLGERMLQKDDINTIIKKSGKEFNEIVKDNKLNPFLLLDIDTILISSRHMYRMPYSLNEKSGWASIPIEPEKVLNFDVKTAEPENVNVLLNHRFLDRTKSTENEGKRLLLQALDFEAKQQEMKTVTQENRQAAKKESERYQITAAMPEEKFPPCMKKAFLGLEDGKKRFLFLAINFLSSVGWNYDEIEKKLLEWNKKNKEPLRENYLLGQIRYAKSQNKKVLPPNCANINYYQDLHICEPDELCRRIKNPVNYTIIKAKRQKENEMKNKPKVKKARVSKKQISI